MTFVHRGCEGSGAVDGRIHSVDSCLPTDYIVSGFTLCRPLREDPLGKMFRYPVGILLFKFCHDYDFVARLAAKGRDAVHSAMFERVRPRVANV